MIRVLGDGGFFFKNPHLHIWFEEVWMVLDILGYNLGYGGPPPYLASALFKRVACHYNLFGTGKAHQLPDPTMVTLCRLSCTPSVAILRSLGLSIIEKNTGNGLQRRVKGLL